MTVKNAVIAALALLAVSPAHAQVCKEITATSGSGKANLDCDMRYRDSVITCDAKNPGDVVGANPACPAKPMPMIDTPKKSYIADYSATLFSYPRDAKKPSLPYLGPYTLGTAGDSTKAMDMVGNTPVGAPALAPCRAKLKFDIDPDGSSTDAKLGRLMIDNCTNEYIIQASLYPYQKEKDAHTRLRSGDDPENPGKPIDIKTQCQPLMTYPTAVSNEYSASDYLQAAWKKTMVDASYRKTPGAKGEPHLPNGTTIAKPVPLPSSFPEVLLSSIAALPYEEIIDPTHPFSPRWDFTANDRDYSKPAENALATPGIVANFGQMQTYMTDPKDTVFCAGLKKADKESDSAKKEELEVPVDVLEFRRPAFEAALLARTDYNATCYKNKAPFGGNWVPGFAAAAASYCYDIKMTLSPPYIYTRGKACWECFGLDGKVDDESQHPPCTANYLGKDLSISGAWPGGRNLFRLQAQCNRLLVPRDPKYNMDKVCADLRKPYTPLNKLKMRYHPDDDQNAVVLKDGVLEGMRFKEYFNNHMPYPRIWDSDRSLQKVSTADGNTQPPLDTTGQYTAIVGIGREAAANVASDNAPTDPNGKKRAENFVDQRCKTMGWGGTSVEAAGSTIQLPDPMTSWTEFKLYQTRTLRNIGISCLGRYEKVFKPGSAENMMLLATGADWSKVVVTKCAPGETTNCEDMTLKAYQQAGSPANDTQAIYLKALSQQAIPNPWAGYLAAAKPDIRFPIWGGANTSANTSASGLDNAKLGDIILMPNGPNDNASKPGLAKLAMVTEVNLPNNSNCASKKNCYVKVFEADNGKYPDICGTTDTWGAMKARYYFKPDHLPKEATEEYARIRSLSDCEETGISHCEMSAWDRLNIYRVANDMREGSPTVKAIDNPEGR